MLSKFLKSISYPKKSQVTVYIFTVMAALVLTAFVIVETGKTAKDKTFTDNSVDAGALATASVMATGFNYITEKNDANESDHNKKEADKELEKNKGEIPGPTPGQQMRGSMKEVQRLIEQFSQQAQNAPICQSAVSPAQSAIEKARTQMDNCDELLNDLDKYNEKQREDLKNQADNLYGESGNQKNYYDTGISQGYKIAFQNAGISHRLGRLGQQMYSAFLQSLEPGSVQSGEPKTFFWVDGSGRPHMVTVIVSTEAVNNWTVVCSEDNVETTKAKVRNGKGLYEMGMKVFEQAKAKYENCPADEMCVWYGYCVNSFGECEDNPAGDALMKQGEKLCKQGLDDYLEPAIKGLENDKDVQRGQSSDLDPETPKYIKDIHHSRTVQAMSFQFHMGSPVKSVYGDIDTMTFYPPVQSSAVATFNYDGSGKIDGQSPSCSHSSGLISAF